MNINRNAQNTIQTAQMKNKILTNTENFVKQFHQDDTTGHDWWHVNRVTKLALLLAQKENADLFLVGMAALLHDVDDWKFVTRSSGKVKAYLNTSGLAIAEQDAILAIIAEVSFKGAGVETPANTIESCCVQDADRLDAIGAIGIARAFAYGGSKNRALYEPDEKPLMHSSFHEYQAAKSHTISHFYEKLLLLKDRMNTPTGKMIAEARHRFMEQYLEQFFREWNLE